MQPHMKCEQCWYWIDWWTHLIDSFAKRGLLGGTGDNNHGTLWMFH